MSCRVEGNKINYNKGYGINEKLKHGHDTNESSNKEGERDRNDDEPMLCTLPTRGKIVLLMCEGVNCEKMLSVQSLQLLVISPTSSILILRPTAIGGDSPFCPGCFPCKPMLDPLRPLSRDLPLSKYSSSIGPPPSACVFANLMFKMGRLSLRSRCENREGEDRSEDTRDLDREASLWPLVM